MSEQVTILRGLTVEEFLAFTDLRPDHERWELIEGEPVLQASPTSAHQMIVTNLGGILRNIRIETKAYWIAYAGVGTRVPSSPGSLPTPDLMIVAANVAPDSPVADQAIVLFEVLSKSNSRADQKWRHKVYTSTIGLEHYVTIDARKVEIVRHDREDDWVPVPITRENLVFDLPAINVAIPLAEIYRWTPLWPNP